MAEVAERQEKLDRARAAIAAYQQTDREFAVGGLSLDRYNMLLSDAEPAAEDMSPMERWQLGWLQFEHALSSNRFPPEGVKQSVHRKQVAARIERAKNTLRSVRKAESLSGAQRALVQVELSSLDLYADTALGNPLVSPAGRKQYMNTLLGIAERYDQFFDEPGSDEAYTITAALLLTNLADDHGVPLFLPAPPRQPWHINIHETHLQPPRRVFITDGSQEPPDEDVVVILHDMLDTAWPPGEDFGLYPTLGAMYECRRNYDIQHSSVKYTESSAYSAYLRMQELRPPLVAVTRVLERRIAEAPALPQTVILPEVAKEEIVERGMLPAATWYLHEWDGEVTPDFITHMRALEATRAEESLLPEEQRILGWMQLAYAQHLAVQAEGDSAQLVTAREQFKAAIDTFMRAVKGFERSQQAGDVIDALLTLEASQAYRALYTSSDKYAIKKQITAYTEKVAELFLLIRDRAAGLEAADEQMQVITASMERILLCLLQTAAEDEFERRVVVPARLNTQGDVIAYVSESTERAVTYDVDRQVVIHIVDGNEIKAKPHQVFIGRDMLGEPEELLAMLGEIAATIIPIEQAQPAGKKAKGGKATRKPVRLPTRSDKTNQLAEAIWYKIFDAAEGVDDDIQE